METYSLKDALIELENTWEIEAPLGSQSLGARERFLIVLDRLRDKLCPKFEKMKTVLESEEAALIAALIDVVGPQAVELAYAVGSLYRVISIYGIDRFCREPENLFDADG